MRNWTFSLAATFAAVSLVFAAQAVAGKVKDTPAKVKIDYCRVKKGPVPFDHLKHDQALKIPCKDCHHKSTRFEAEDKVPRCAACHKGADAMSPLLCTEASLKKNSYHVMCVDCHKKKAKGPTKCAQCHKK